MNNGGASSHADTLIGQWKVIYMGGIPGYYGIKGRSYISLLHENYGGIAVYFQYRAYQPVPAKAIALLNPLIRLPIPK